MYKMKNKVILSMVLLALLIMAVGYATFATQIQLDGNAEIVGSWDIRITNIAVINASEGIKKEIPSFTDTTITFHAKLMKPGDQITYRVTIQNLGTITAKLENIHFISDEENGSSAIQYETTSLSPILNAGDETTFDIIITYDSHVESIPEIKTKTITGIIEYIQA